MQEQATLPQLAPGRDLALERSQKVSRALHDAARKARLTVRSGAAWQVASRGGRANRSFAIVSALVLFVLPTLTAAIFFGLVASDQFEAESQFAVKGREFGLSDLVGSNGSSQLQSLQNFSQTQDGLVIVDYVNSRALVEKLDREIGLRAMYTKPGIDYFFRFDPEEPIEDFVRYWRKRLYSHIDASGIITVKVRAFSREDALRIGQAIVSASEQLVNDMSGRSRRDALAKSQEEVARAEQRLVTIREEVRRLRDKERLIDPAKSGEALLKLVGDLRLDKAKLENEYKTSSRSLIPTAPQMQVLKARLDALNGQIAGIENEMTAAEGAGDQAALSGAMPAFDKAKLDQSWAEKFYQTVAASLEKARLDAERQQVYLESFVHPVMPEGPEFPRRAWNTFMVALAAFGLWFTVNYLRAALRG
ncbi:MAG: hypothetical protein JO048_09245 [Methylobacteriaceae bacterium]|nr:hypothetical protein [Methylobacteriaceae bacterium]